MVDRRLVSYINRHRDGKIVFFRKVTVDLERLRDYLPFRPDLISDLERAKNEGNNSSL